MWQINKYLKIPSVIFDNDNDNDNVSDKLLGDRKITEKHCPMINIAFLETFAISF